MRNGHFTNREKVTIVAIFLGFGLFITGGILSQLILEVIGIFFLGWGIGSGTKWR